MPLFLNSLSSVRNQASVSFEAKCGVKIITQAISISDECVNFALLWLFQLCICDILSNYLTFDYTDVFEIIKCLNKIAPHWLVIHFPLCFVFRRNTTPRILIHAKSQSLNSPKIVSMWSDWWLHSIWGMCVSSMLHTNVKNITLHSQVCCFQYTHKKQHSTIDLNI